MKPSFLLMGACNFFGYFAWYIPFFYIPDMAVVNGIDRSNANFLISIAGELKIKNV